MPDYGNYVDMFHSARAGNINASPDMGYTLLNMLVGLFFSNSVAIFLVVAFLAVRLTLKCYKEYSHYVFLAVLFYFVHAYFSREMMQIRAGLALAICLYNVRNLQKGRMPKFLGWQLVAASIHLVAIFFVLIPLLKKINFSTRTWVILLAVCFVVGTFVPMGDLMRMLPENKFTIRALSYIGWDYDVKLGVLSNMATLKQLALSAVWLARFNTIKEKVRYGDILMVGYLFSTCWLMLFNDFAIVAARIATVWSVGEPILISSLLFLFTPCSRLVTTVMLVAVALVFLIYNLSKGAIEYKFIFLQ
jgi:hypothetical protein